MLLEVVTRGEGNVPTIGKAEITRSIERLCEPERIAHGALVDGFVAILKHGDTIGKCERPRQLEMEIAIFVDLGLFFLHRFLLCGHKSGSMLASSTLVSSSLSGLFAVSSACVVAADQRRGCAT